MSNTDPFNVTLNRILAERGITPHALSVQLQARHSWGSSTAASKMGRGELTPGREGLEFIADVLGVEPETFAEYRLAVARDALDWREVGLEQALANLGEKPVKVNGGRPDAVKRAEAALEQALEELRR